MKAKLIKTDTDNFVLQTIEGIISGTLEPTKFEYKLSLKNCQAVENGYDLEELARKRFLPEYEPNSMFSIFEIDCKREGFVEGAKTILEILGDKKFSEEQMKRIYEKGYSSGRSELSSRESDKVKYDYIQSLQQTEWDVETCCYVDNTDGWLDADSFNSPLCTNTGIPKLDSEGCLILKRL